VCAVLKEVCALEIRVASLTDHDTPSSCIDFIDSRGLRPGRGRTVCV
jgi:hypothetical protein